LSHPFDPNYGKLTDRFAFEISTGKVLRGKTFQDGLVKDGILPVNSRKVHDEGM